MDDSSPKVTIGAYFSGLMAIVCLVISVLSLVSVIWVIIYGSSKQMIEILPPIPWFGWLALMIFAYWVGLKFDRLSDALWLKLPEQGAEDTCRG